MSLDKADVSGSATLDALRRRGQFLFSGLLWSAAAGFVVVASGYALILYHYAIAFAERFRFSLGLSAPSHGPDWWLLAAIASGPMFLAICLAVFAVWYRRLWSRKLMQVWPRAADRRKYSRWWPVPLHATQSQRSRRSEYLAALERSALHVDYGSQSALLLSELEKDIAERALTIGLTVGISHSRAIDLFTIVVGALELQLHVLSRLGKRPSWATWRLLIGRCGASLFINSYLNRQDSLSLNIMIKKAGMGLYAAGDLMEGAAHHISESDFDLDDALNLHHSGIVGMATKSLELGATMALTVGQVGMHILGSLIESVGDELTQGALAAGILYFHGIALAADTLALDEAHRRSSEMNRNFRDGVWKMGEIAGTILRDVVRQRRTSFREKRRQMVRSLPKSAYAGIQALFGRKAESASG